jgi:hypothetical protein
VLARARAFSSRGKRALGAHAATAIVASFAAGLVPFVWSAVHARAPEFPPAPVWFAALISSGGLLLLAAYLRRARGTRDDVLDRRRIPGTRDVLVVVVERAASARARAVSLGATLIMGVQIALAANGARSAPLYVLADRRDLLRFVLRSVDAHCERSAFSSSRFAISVAGAALFALWPVVARERWRDNAVAWRRGRVRARRVGARAPSPVRRAMELRARCSSCRSASSIIAGIGALRLFALRDREERAQRIGRIWFSAVAIFFAALISAAAGRTGNRGDHARAVFGLGLAVLSARIEHKGIAWAAAGRDRRLDFPARRAPTMGFVRALRAPRRERPRVLLPVASVAAASLGAAWFLRARANAIAQSTIAGLCAVCLAVRVESTSRSRTPSRTARASAGSFLHEPARDLTVSLAWALYALVLLALGASRGRQRFAPGPACSSACSRSAKCSSSISRTSRACSAPRRCSVSRSRCSWSRFFYQRFVFPPRRDGVNQGVDDAAQTTRDAATSTFPSSRSAHGRSGGWNWGGTDD